MNVLTAVDAVHANQDCKLEAKGVACAEYLEFILFQNQAQSFIFKIYNFHL